jgi:hypothetical protein
MCGPDLESERLSPPRNHQPLSAAGYALLSFVGLCIALFVGWFIISKSPVLLAGGIFNQAYYILLAVLGLAVAAFLFGAMRSAATVSGNYFGLALDLGGPAAGAALVVVGGFWLTKPNPSFDLTIRLQGDSISEGNTGDDWATVDIGQKHDRLPIDRLGDAIDRSLNTELRNQQVRVSLDSKRFRIKDQQESYAIPADGVLRLNVEPVDPRIKKRKELATLLDSVVEKMKASQIANDEFVFPAVRAYINSPTVDNWSKAVDGIRQSLQPIKDGIELSIKYDAQLQQDAEPILSQISLTESDVLNRQFERQFTRVREIWNGRAFEKRQILTHENAPPSVAEVRAWQKDLLASYKALQAEIQRLSAKLKKET